MKAKALARFLLLVALLLPTHLSSAADLPEEAHSLGGLKIGSSRAYVESIYGTPDRLESSMYTNIGPNHSDVKVLYYYYGNSFKLLIRTDRDSVMDINTTANNGIETPQGLHVGSTTADIERTFGWLPEGLEGNGTPMNYAYSYEGIDSTLIFYTYEDGTIYEIRLMEDLF